MNKINHIAIIMDGNGRWGKKRGKSRKFGHINGVRVLEKIVKASIKLNIPIVTFYTFSTENWKRPKTEINFLFKLIEQYFVREIDNVVKNNIKINIIGNIKSLPTNISKLLIYSMKRTNNCKKILVNLAINYGSKNEIIDATNKVMQKRKKISIKKIKENLYTGNLPDPDILIRTGGKKKVK